MKLMVFASLLVSSFATAQNKIECDMSRVIYGDAFGLKGIPLAKASAEFGSQFSFSGTGSEDVSRFEITGTYQKPNATVTIKAHDRVGGKDLQGTFTLVDGVLFQKDLNTAPDQGYGNSTNRISCIVNGPVVAAANHGCPNIQGEWTCGENGSSGYYWDQKALADGFSTEYNTVIAPFGQRFVASPKKSVDVNGSYAYCPTSKTLEMYIREENGNSSTSKFSRIADTMIIDSVDVEMVAYTDRGTGQEKRGEKKRYSKTQCRHRVSGSGNGPFISTSPARDVKAIVPAKELRFFICSESAHPKIPLCEEKAQAPQFGKYWYALWVARGETDVMELWTSVQTDRFAIDVNEPQDFPVELDAHIRKVVKDAQAKRREVEVLGLAKYGGVPPHDSLKLLREYFQEIIRVAP